ncbi:MAG: segregation/condensation protein A [Bacteroidetes bacterium]|nr:segregation/condensation protein A [Bacteroidota bacterium]
MSYQIVLPQFEGPFDLLLFFIERDELDIYDIPIYKLTNDFLAYVRRMEDLNVELASEFILVAATLMRIKAKTLLPRKEVDAEGNEIDPREELVQRLIEYKKYKAVVSDLQEMEENRQSLHSRGNILKEQKSLSQINSVEAELESVNLYKLMKIFQRVAERYQDRNLKLQHTIVKYDYTIKKSKVYILDIVTTKKKANFSDLFDICENRIHAVFTLLAILEMVQLREVEMQVGEGYNNFWLKAVA